MRNITDIDIDFADPITALKGLRHVPATLYKDGERFRHNSGVYFQDVPVDPLDGMAAWDSETAAANGFFKIDFLSLSIYRGIHDEDHLVNLLVREPPWHRLAEHEVVEKLTHIGQYFDIVQKIDPHSIEELAICIALIRPGKRYLVKRPRFEIDREIWSLPAKTDKTDKYSYKKSHAIAYAALIVVQMNLLIEQGVI